MVSSSILAFLVIFLLCFHAPAVIYSIYPEVLAISVLLAGFLWGPRAIAILLPACWSILFAAWNIEDRLAPELQGRDFEITGIVCDIPATDAGVQRFRFLLDADDQSPGLPAHALISWYESDTPVRAGERWHLTIRLKRPRGASNPAGFDFERWAFMQNIGATGYVRSAASNRRLSSAAGCALAAFRQRIATKLKSSIPDAEALGHMLALTVGIRDQLGAHDWAVLRRTGTAHLMAISGLHIGLAAGFAFFCLRQAGSWLLLLRIRCRPLLLARVGAIAGAVSYSALAGFSVPTIRALVMTSVVILLTGLQRTVSVSSIVAVALYVILWIGPFSMLSAGFWLSFGAVTVLLLSGLGGVLTATEPQSRFINVWCRFRQLIRAQLCLSIGLLPATAFFFGQVSLVAPLANLLVVPLFAVSIVPLLIVGIILLLVAPQLAGPVLGLADTFLAWIIAFLDWLNDVSVIPVAAAVPSVSVLVALTGVGIVTTVIWPRPLPARVPVVMLLLVLAALSTTHTMVPALRVVVMDVGQGLAVLLQTPGHNVLFDTGPRYRRGDAGRSVVLPVLRHFGVTQLDHLIVSHGDADHAGGADTVLAAYPQAQFLAPEQLDVSAERFRLCRSGDHWQHDGVSFRFLHPDLTVNSDSMSDNDASCVLFVESAGFSLLLPGDIEQRAERMLLTRGDLQPVDLVLAPHHGSRTSSTRSFVSATRPGYVVFSAGYRNQWRFPAPEVLKRWSDSGACTLTTGVLGALIFEAHGDGPLKLVKRMRVDEARIWKEVPPVGSKESHCMSWASTN